MPSRIRITDYRVFYDGQASGHATIGGTLVRLGDEWVAVYGSGPFEDDEAGQHPFLVRTRDWGRTWSVPEPFGPPLTGDPTRQSLGLGLHGPTRQGTLLAIGSHMRLAEGAQRFYHDLSFRAYTLLIGRREVGAPDFAYQEHPPGTFLGEQFMERGVELASGRLVFTLWGVARRGENWQCGVTLSDDDGRTWRYRQVGYEPDRGIRDNPGADGYPAGYNEQSLFVLPDGRLVSLIRGREKLGRLPDSPRDTWFFRSESRDHGETWSPPRTTNVAGTGAAGVGWVLPDGSLVHACRVPYSRTLYALPEPELFGLHLVRSGDAGVTWQTEHLLQRDPEGRPFTNHYNAMNGQFVPVDEGRVLYVFGQFDVAEAVYRMLAVELAVE
ncbi:MAG: sialidase family protein [Candidatus Latescibacterota bacterium]